MRTTVNIEETMLEKAKAVAVGRGVTLGDLVDEALRSYLSRDHQTPPPPFKLYTVRGELVNPNLDLDRTSALIVAEDEGIYNKPA